MPFYFIGQEDHDFARIGTVSVDTATTAARRTAYARCSLKVGAAGGSTDGWQGQLTAAVSSFWWTCRASIVNFTVSTCDFLMFNDGSTRRLGLKADASGHVVLFKRNAAGTNTTLATSTLVVSAALLIKFDVQVTYGTSGVINVYLDNVLWLTYSGDVTTDAATTLSAFVLGSTYVGAYSVNWSEIICGTADTRAMSLCTLAPAANGNAFAWTGSYASLNEVTLDDATLSTSAAANDLLQTTVSSSGITGTPAIRALCVSSRAQKGGTGPQNIQMNVRTGGVDYFSGTLSLPAALDRVASIFETNPATSGAWAYTDLTAAAFNIGAKSIT